MIIFYRPPSLNFDFFASRKHEMFTRYNLILNHRLRRWTSIKLALAKRLVLAMGLHDRHKLCAWNKALVRVDSSQDILFQTK